jgi:predicted GNAT superfamily acetyltransferase
MKRLLLMLCAALVLTYGVRSSASAQNHVSNIAVMHNKSDAWVWVTAYNRWGEILGRAFCVNPGQRIQYGYTVSYVYEVRVEVTHSGCSHPVYLDQRRGYPYGYGEMTYTYYVKGTNGNYTFNETP